jgi:hypothetical protein
VACILAIAPTALAGSDPWSDANKGTRITYRVSDVQSGLSSGPAMTMEVTEEVIEANEASVKVKITKTRRKGGEREARESMAEYPRKLTREQYLKLMDDLGFTHGSAFKVKVSGQEYQCIKHRKEQESPDRDPDKSVYQNTVVCKDMPGWIYRQWFSSISWRNDIPRREMLEVVP